MKKYITVILAICGIFFLGIWLSPKQSVAKKAKAGTKIYKTIAENSQLIEVKPFVTAAGWGYTVYRQGKPYIRQNTIPAVEGNKGFVTREQAVQAGKLVAYKIEHSIFPPTLSRQELDSLHLLN